MENFELSDNMREWIISDSKLRLLKRINSSKNQLRSFYDNVQPKLAMILEHLSKCPIDALEDSDRDLLFLTLMLAEVSIAIEKYDGSPTVPKGFDVLRVDEIVSMPLYA